MSRKGDFICTYTGVHFYPLDPRPEEIKIEDIAHALARICRFNGHLDIFYSVGQHVLTVATELSLRGYSPKIALYGLVHDFSEAYITDIPTPVKNFLPDYQEVENNLQKAIYDALIGFPITEEEYSVVKQVDHEVLLVEAYRMSKHQNWVKEVPALEGNYKFRIENPEDVEARIISLYRYLLFQTKKKEEGIAYGENSK